MLKPEQASERRRMTGDPRKPVSKLDEINEIVLNLSWGFAPGWYRTAPSALLAVTASGGPKARHYISLGRGPRIRLDGLQGLKARSMKAWILV
jgi:hypothetical protein